MPEDANLIIVDPNRKTFCDVAFKSAAVQSGSTIVRSYDWLCRCLTSETISPIMISRVFVDDRGAPMRMTVAPSMDAAVVQEMRKAILVRRVLNTFRCEL